MLYFCALHRNQLKQPTHRGFTLIELLVVLILLGILATLAFPLYRVMVERAEYAQVRTTMGSLKREIELYRSEFQAYPKDVREGVTPEGVSGWIETIEFRGVQAKLDWDNWPIAQEQCYTQIGFLGENNAIDYKVRTIVAQPGRFVRVGDDLVLGIDIYSC